MAGVSLDAIVAKIKSTVSEALTNEVANEVKADLVSKAASDVYGAYDPQRYWRRYSFEQQGKYQTEQIGEMKIGITPDVSFNPGYGTHNSGNMLAGLVNYGDGWGGYNYDYVSFGPRPFIDNAFQEWDGGKLKQSIDSALKSAGFSIK